MTKWNKIGYGFLAAAAIAMVGCSGISAYAAEDTTTESETTWNDEWTEEEIAYWDSLDWGILEEDIEQVDLSLGEPEELNAAGGTATLMGGATQTPGQWIFDQSAQKWWYRHNDGGYSTKAWELINGEWYYFDVEGYMVTGWVWDEAKWYYCHSSGAMLKGWVKVNNVWYYLHESKGEWIDTKGTQMVSEALNYLGNPYVYGKNDLINGTDCSGYTQQVHLNCGITISRKSVDQYTKSSHHLQRTELQPGDLVFYSRTKYSSGIHHVAFYAGKICIPQGNQITYYDNQIVHAATSDEGIKYSSIDGSSGTQFYATYWR